MANEVETPTPAAEPTTTEQPTKVEETKVEETKEVQVETPKAEDVFDLNDIEQNEDGDFVLTIDKDDPETTVYKGKTPDEVLKAAKKGLLEKDKYIRELKSKELMQSAKRKPIEETEEIDIEAPDYNQIFSKTLKEYKIPEEMVNWTRDQWKEYEATEGAVFAMKAMNSLENARLVAQERADALNVDYLNDLILKEETEQVIEMVKDSGTDFGKSDYDEILKEIHKDKTNSAYFRKDGVRKNGVIPRLVSKKLFELKTQKVTKKVSKEKDEEVAKSRLTAEKVVSIPATKKEVEKAKPNPKTIDEAKEALLKEKW
jgi:hypothetical protein